MARTILLLGALDTKGAEYAFLRDRILALGCGVLTVDFGIFPHPAPFPVDLDAGEVAAAGGGSLTALRAAGDRGEAMRVMAAGVAEVARRLHAAGRFDGAIGMGGTGGTSVICSALRALPLGVPKLCLSTAASGDTSAFVGTKDIALLPSVVDVAGLNRVSRILFTRAAGAICGMVAAEPTPAPTDRPVVVASMFGNTTTCVDACRAALEAEGYEVLVFHATGTGGRTMEALIDEGLVDGCLDVTTTEWADQVCGGVFSAGPDRLAAPGRARIPHLIVPGCVDMANFGPLDTVPARYRGGDRVLYQWNPAVTLLRTNVEENQAMGAALAEKANANHAAGAPVAVLIPLRGVSILDGNGQPFCDRVADEALFTALRAGLDPAIPVVEVDANINDEAFSGRAVELFLELMERRADRGGK